MKDPQGGMVLITTIMMIVILTLLILTVMQGVLLYIKSNNQLIHNHQALHQMEGIIQRLNLNDATCVVHDKTPNQLVALLATQEACQLTDGIRQYVYILEDFGVYPCLQVMLDESLQGSRHILVTIKNSDSSNLILQLRIAMPAVTEACESLTSHQIRPGVVSWRNVHHQG